MKAVVAGLCVLAFAGQVRAARVTYTEPSGSNLDVCLLTIVGGDGSTKQTKRVPISGPTGGIQRTVRIDPARPGKDEGMALNIACCDTRGRCADPVQTLHDFVDMMLDEPTLAFDGTTVAYTEPSTFLNDHSAASNVAQCSITFLDAQGLALQAYRRSASSATGGGSQSFVPLVTQSTRDRAAFLEAVCLTDYGIRGAPRRISVQGVFP